MGNQQQQRVPDIEYGIPCRECAKQGKDFTLGLFEDGIACTRPTKFHRYTQEQLDEMIAERDAAQAPPAPEPEPAPDDPVSEPEIEQTFAAEAPTPEPPKAPGRVAVIESEEQKNGDVKVTVTIPEWLKHPIQTEAENRGLSFEQAAGEMFEIALTAWYGLPAPVQS